LQPFLLTYPEADLISNLHPSINVKTNSVVLLTRPQLTPSCLGTGYFD